MEEELTTIDSLLQDNAFLLQMATTLDAAYYAGLGEAAPPFLTPDEETATVVITSKEEKIAINLAGFYALECGLGLLSDTGTLPVVWLQRIARKEIDPGTLLLLNRFANATWKAGQPFRDPGRIKRPTFTGANHLPAEEVTKDEVQISNAAKKLLLSMEPIARGSMDEQMHQLRKLLQDTAYAVEMAAWMDSGYYTAQQQSPPPFLTAADEAPIKKNTKDIKIATSGAGFYALECGLNYLATTRRALPSATLKSIIDNSITKEDKMLFARFANATWKAGQPFRGLSRITRETFTPFYFLKEADIDKDLAQVKAAAEVLLGRL